MSRFAPWLLVVLLSACPSNPGGTDSLLRPDVVLVDDGQLSQDHCYEFDPVTCTQWRRYVLLDVAQDGDTVVAAARMDINTAPIITNGLALFVSRDRGATWKTVSTDFSPVGWTYALQLYFVDGRLSVLARKNLDPATGFFHYLVDLDTGQVTSGPQQVDRFAPDVSSFDRVHDGKLSVMQFVLQSFRHWTFDLRTGAVDEDAFLRCDEGPCQVGPYEMYPTTDPPPDAWRTTEITADDAGVVVVCQLTASLSAQTHFRACSADTPQLFRASNDHQVSGTVLWNATGWDGHAWYARVDTAAPTGVTKFDLGAGEVLWDQGGQVTVVRRPDNTPAFFQMLGGKPHELGLPTSPCRTGCTDVVHGFAGVSGRNAQFERVFELDDGTFLVFFNLTTVDDQFRTRNQLLVARASDANTPQVSDGSSALEQQCARLGLCFPGTADVEGCPKRWLELRGVDSAFDRAYQAFIAATDCAGLRNAEPLATGSSEPCAESHCEGPTALICGGVLQGGLSCDTVGTTCSVQPTLGPWCTPPTTCPSDLTPPHCDGQNAVQCPSNLKDCAALGLECAVMNGNPDCVVPGASCTTAGCSGTIATTCREGHPVPRVDCGRLGMDCANGDCALRTAEPACTGPFRCDGTKLRWCAQLDAPSFLSKNVMADCAALGARCVPATNDSLAHCAH